MKNSSNFMILIFVTSAAIIPAQSSAIQADLTALRERAAAVVQKAKTLKPDPKYWADKTVAHAKRMWFCFRNKSECSKSEVMQARAWIIGVPTAVLTALLVVGNVVVNNRTVERAKKEAAQQAAAEPTVRISPEVVPYLAIVIQRNADISAVNSARDLTQEQKNLIAKDLEKYEFRSVTITDSLLNEAIAYLKKILAGVAAK